MMSKKTVRFGGIGKGICAQGLLFLLFYPFLTFAGESRVELSFSSEVSFGDPVQLFVKVVNPEKENIRLSLPPVSGFRIEGPFSGGTVTSTVIVNGRMEQSFAKKFIYKITPTGAKPGKYTFGPVTVYAGGKKYLESGTVSLTVGRRAGLSFDFSCQLSKKEGEVGEPFRVIYRLRYPANALAKSSSDFESLLGYENPLRLAPPSVLELKGVKVEPTLAFPGEPFSRERFGNTVLLLQQRSSVGTSGEAFEELYFAFEVTPLKVGTIVIPPTKAQARLLTGRWTVVEDFFSPFGRRKVAEARTFSASTEELTYRVKPLPTQGRPPGFNGAIGSYTIKVTTQDRVVHAFDPIRLTVTIQGKGLLEEVMLPQWNELPWLTKDFDIPNELDPGKLTEHGKVFHQTIRPRHAKIKAIPPLPFPYYDPWKKKYVIAKSEPIPITVKAVQTVTVEQAYRKEPKANAAQVGTQRKQKVIFETEDIGGNFFEIGTCRGYIDPKAYLKSPSFAAVLLIPPLLFLAILGTMKLTERDPVEVAKRNAFRRAMRELSKSTLSLDSLIDVYQNYFRNKFSLPAGEITSDQIEGALSGKKVSYDLIRRCHEHMNFLLERRFGGGSDEAGRELVEKTRELLREIDKCIS